MKLRLIKASMTYRTQICDMLEEWYGTGEKIVPYAIRRLDYHDFENYCENLECKQGTVERVPDSTFFCLDEERNLVVGAVNIRHYLNESLLLDGGHIGDGVRPSERRKGIATGMIGLALEECRKLGIRRVLMVCDKDNIGSAKSIRNNGGVLEDEPVVDGIPQQRYWIDLISDSAGANTQGRGDSLNRKKCPDMIRHMSIEEIPECVNVVRRAFVTVADQFGFTEENAPRFTAFATDDRRLRYHFSVEKRPMYVYLKDNRIVGYYSLAVMSDPEMQNHYEMELNNLAVLPEYRHQGIGEMLLKDCFRRAAELGGRKLKIGIVEENTVLRKWYEDYGFLHVGTEKLDFFPFTCGYMERPL